MRKPKILAGLALAGLLLSTSALSPIGPLAVTPVQAQSASVSFNLFFDELEPHGVWVRHPQYRYVFCPTGVDTRWRPYTRGRWLYLADAGWYFASDEPFAWATYHYGRWFDDDNLGWCWVPGTKWAPAWVSWRRGGDAVGWAPLPPQGDGFSVSVEVVREDFPEDYWVFVPTRSFIEPDLSVSIVFGNDARSYYQETEFLGPVVVEGDVVTNNVIEVNYIEQQINQEITVYNVEEAAEPAAAAVTGEQTVQIFSQDVEEPTEDVAPPEAVDEAEASEVLAAEGGTAGAEADTTEATETDAAAPQATDPAATETETADPVNAEEDTDATSDVEEPTTTTEEATETEEPTATESETQADQPAATDEETTESDATQTGNEAAPAADEAEPVTEPTDTQVEEDATQETAPADTDADEPEATAPAEEESVTPDCPPELLVDGVCQPAGEDAGEVDAGAEESDASPAGADDTGGTSTDEGAQEESVTE